MLWPALAMMRAVPVEVLRLFEIGQHIVPSPTIVTQGFPIIKIVRLAAYIDHRID